MYQPKSLVQKQREAILALTAEKNRAEARLNAIRKVLRRGEEKPLQKLREIADIMDGQVEL